MIRTCIAILALAGALAVRGPAAVADSPAKVARIGLLDAGSPTVVRRHRWKVFHQQMRALGYIEGENVAFERRWARNKRDRLQALARELIGLKIDVVVTSGSPAAFAASRATGTIPIVMALASQAAIMPALVRSLARPGGNVTGLTSIPAEVMAKRLELAEAIVPSASRMAILGVKSHRNFRPAVTISRAAARTLGVSLLEVGVRSADELDTAFSRMEEARIDAFVVVPAPTMLSARASLARLAARTRIPGVLPGPAFVEAGGLASYGGGIDELFRRSAYFVDRILKGANPAELPVEQLNKFELVVNLKAAKALGIIFPRSVLLRATEVIE